MRFHEVVFCKNFAVNLMLFCQLHKLSYWWDNRSEFNHICKINQNYIIIITFMKLHEQNMLKHISVNYNYIKIIFFNWWNYFNSWTEWKSVTADVWIWHLKLEHAESQSLQHLVTCSENAWIWRRVKDSITIDCNDCAAAKISWKIHCEFKFNEKNSEEHLAIDFHDFKLNSEDFTFLMTITDHWSDFIWDFYFSNQTAQIIIQFLTFFFNFLKWQYKIEFKMMKMNEKLYTQKLKIRKFIKQQRMRIEFLLFYTQVLNDSSKYLKSVIKQKIIVMKSSFNLLKKL